MTERESEADKFTHKRLGEIEERLERQSADIKSLMATLEQISNMVASGLNGIAPLVEKMRPALKAFGIDF